MMPKFSLKEFALSLVTPHPARDWAFVLCVLLILFFSLASYAGYLFWGIQSGVIVGEAHMTRDTLPNVTRGSLEEALEMYRIRRVNFEARNFPHPALPDPAR